MKKDDKTPRKKLSLSFGSEENIPNQLQEKLQQIKALYEKAQPKSIPTPQNKIKKEKTAPLSQEEEKKAKALQHEKEQQALKREAQQLRFEKVKQTLDWLYEYYPLCFNKDEPKPLKRRIEKDILANLPSDLPFSRLSIRKAIAYYTHSPKYRQTLSNSSHRYNLLGEQVEEIKPEHQQLAQEQLEAYLMRKKAKSENKKRFSKQQTKDKS